MPKEIGFDRRTLSNDQRSAREETKPLDGFPGFKDVQDGTPFFGGYFPPNANQKYLRQAARHTPRGCIGSEPLISTKVGIESPRQPSGAGQGASAGNCARVAIASSRFGRSSVAPTVRRWNVVPEIPFGLDFVAAMRAVTETPLDVHSQIVYAWFEHSWISFAESRAGELASRESRACVEA